MQYGSMRRSNLQVAAHLSH